jgi:hypothetical protein
MKLFLCFGMFVCLFAFAAMRAEEKPVKEASEPNIGHMVYFKLKDNSSSEKDKLVAACKKYLAGHDGTVYFSAGVLAEDFKREVNVRDWDVALHLVFKNKAAHDKYQDHERHLKFIEENKGNWEKVRVFDSVVK